MVFFPRGLAVVLINENFLRIEKLVIEGYLLFILIFCYLRGVIFVKVGQPTLLDATLKALLASSKFSLVTYAS